MGFHPYLSIHAGVFCMNGVIAIVIRKLPIAFISDYNYTCMKTRALFLFVLLPFVSAFGETICHGEAEHYVLSSFKGGAGEPFVQESDKWSGGKAVCGITNSMYLLYNFYVEKEGTYELMISYSYTGEKAPEQGGYICTRINNQERILSELLLPEGTEPGEVIKKYTVPVYCTAGWNTLRIGQNGNGKYQPYIDKWEIVSTDKVMEQPVNDADTSIYLENLFETSFSDMNYYSWDLTDLPVALEAKTGTVDETSLKNLTDNKLDTKFTSNSDSVQLEFVYEHPVVVRYVVLNEVLRLGHFELEAWDEAGQVWKKMTNASGHLFDDGALWVTAAGENESYTHYRLVLYKAPGAASIEVADVLFTGYYYTGSRKNGEKSYHYLIDDLTMPDNGEFISCTPRMPDPYNGLTGFQTLDNMRGSKCSFSATTFQLTYEFYTSAKVTSFLLTNATTLDRSIKTFEIQASNDNVHYTTLYRAENLAWKETNMMFGGNIEEPAFYKYYRLDVQENCGSKDFVELSDWLLLGEVQPGDPEWRMKHAPLMTKWSENINPDSVWTEYPRPQKVRKDWINLNGIWKLRKGSLSDTYSADYEYDKRILVPFPIESAISGVMDDSYLNESPRTFFYQRNFDIPASMQGKNMLLHFGASDWQTEVWVNGQFVGEHQGGYDPFTFDITDALTAEGQQEVVVKVTDWTDSKSHFGLVGKQSNAPGNVFYVPVTGIWQTVWLEPVPELFIDDFEITPDVDHSQVKITTYANSLLATNKVRASVYDKGLLVQSVQGALGDELVVDIPNAKLWEPSSPFLYDLKLELLSDNETVLDSVTSYFGMRKVYKAMHNGTMHMFINDEPVFTFGVLDQGYWPDGLYTPPSEEAMLYDLKKMRELGFNMNRKHIKVEPARWYYHCDTMGILVWQDIPGGRRHSDYDEGIYPQYRENYMREATNIIQSLKNCPSIVTWVLFNERWGQFADNAGQKETYGLPLTQEAYALAQELIGDRCLINVGSGSDDCGLGDYKDKHNYPSPAMHPKPDYEAVEVCGEYGGVSLAVEDHMWSTDGFSYVHAKNSEELADYFVQYANGVMGLQASQLAGAVYTQLTDVEIELNGLMTYDRVMKTDESQTARIREAVERNIRNANAEYIVSARTSDENVWKYTTVEQTGWQNPEFDDSTWKNGVAGFGKGNVPNSNIRTNWSTTTIYLRRQINFGNLTAGQIAGLGLLVFHDEDFELYINGILAAFGTGFLTDYAQYPISQEALASIRLDGDNLVAVKCTQSSGGQYIDVAFSIVYPRMDEKPVPPQASASPSVTLDCGHYIVVPNPVKDSFCLKGVAENTVYRVELWDVSGKKVRSFEKNGSRYDVSGLDEGAYFLKIYSTYGYDVSKILLDK